MVFLHDNNQNSNSLALIIGINYNGTQSQLNGCINDATKINDFLINKLGFAPSNITLLTDDTDIKPTFSNIINKLETIITKIQNPDNNIQNVWLSYSGHGTYVQDHNSDEQVNAGDLIGYDEALVPIDYESSGMVTDDILYDKFIKRLPKNITLVSLIDACHSGSALDLPYIYRSSTDTIDINPSVNTENIAKIVKISGCRDSQTSADAYIANKYQGAMTYAFFKTLELHKYNLTCKQLIVHMKRYLTANNYSQIPTLAMSNQNYITEQFIDNINHKDHKPNIRFVLNGDQWCNSETTWNIYDLKTNKTIYDNNIAFDINNEKVKFSIYLDNGKYKLQIFDTYGDGGVNGKIKEVRPDNDNIYDKLHDIQFTSGKTYELEFNVTTGYVEPIPEPEINQIKFNMNCDKYNWESTWNVKDSNNQKVFSTDISFERAYEKHQRYAKLIVGNKYTLMLMDTWGDGGIQGDIINNKTQHKYLEFNWKNKNWTKENGKYQEREFIV
jgi:metacaspase-1